MSRWQRSDWTLGLLTVLTIWAAWEGYMIGNCPANHGCGGCFSQFYAAGTIIRRGEVERLYDQPYFRSLQTSMREDPLRSLYPPTLGLLVAPLTRLSYHEALAAWWVLQAACILAAGALVYRLPWSREQGARSREKESNLSSSLLPAPCSLLPQPWRINVLLALTAMTPLWIGVGIAQLTPMLLLLVLGGLWLHKQGKCLIAGLLLSMLALKPQLAAGLVLWMLLRRDLRTLIGLAAGFALQFVVVAAVLGSGVWRDYLHAMPTISAVTRYYHYSPLVEASFAGIASNIFWTAGLAAWEVAAMKITYAVTAGAATVLLCLVVWAKRPLKWGVYSASAEQQGRPHNEPHPNYEYACGVLFMLVIPPYFLLYDQTLMVVPLVLLWNSPAWRCGVALFATTTALVVNLSLVFGFGLTGIAALATMFYLNGLARPCIAAESKKLQPILTS
jgi:hypothetical protein